MEPTREKPPRMLKHARSGRAFIFVRDEHGRRRQVTLGAWDSPEAQRRFQRELSRWRAMQRGGPEAAALVVAEVDAELTIADAAARWYSHCEAYYRRPDGTPTGESRSCKYAVDLVLGLFADDPLAEFTPRKLKVVRDRMINGDPTVEAEQRRGWSLGVVNQAVGRIRAFVKWCVAEGFVSPSVHTGVCALAPLKRGRSAARETEPTKPVRIEVVDQTLPHLPPVVADMVRIQLLVGMRGCELCAMTTAELDRSESLEPGCWVFRPTYSKVSYRGRQVEYVLGPQAVAILKRYLKVDPAARLFSPAQSEQERHALMRERRKGKVPPSQLDRRVPDPKRPPGPRYEASAYARCIAYACKSAGTPHWSPHALRRARATRVRAEFGIEAARCAIGHQTLDMATLYGHRDLKESAKVAKAIG